MLTCQHHIQWVRQVAGGLHQCILCTQVVTKKDVYPKLEDLPEEFQRRWDAHEATRPPAAVEASGAKAPAAKPAGSAAAAAPGATASGTAPSPRPSPPLRGGEGEMRTAPPPAAHDPASGI